MSEKFFMQDRAQILAVCDFKPFGNKIDDTPSDSETLTKLRATLRQLSEISVAENMSSFEAQGPSLSAQFDGAQPYASMKASAESVFGSDLDGASGKVSQDIEDLNDINKRVEKAIRSMDFNTSSGFNGTLKNNTQDRLDEIVPSNPSPYFTNVKITIADYLRNLYDLLEDAGFSGDVTNFSSTKVFYHLIDLLGQLMNSPRPKILDDSDLGARPDDSDPYIFRKTVTYDLINPVLVAKSPRPERTQPTILLGDIEAGGPGGSGILSPGTNAPALTGDEAFNDDYGLGRHLIAIARELSTSVVAGKYEEELRNPGSASTVALRAFHSALLGSRTATLTLNRQVTNPKFLEADAAFPVLPMMVIGSSGPITSAGGVRDPFGLVPARNLYFPDRFLSVRVADSQFPEHENRPGTVVSSQAQASIFEQLDVNAPGSVGNVEGTRNYFMPALLQSEIPSIRSLDSGNLSNTPNRLTAVEDAFQSAAEDYITYIEQCSSINGLDDPNNLDPVRVSKKLFCNENLRNLLKKMGGIQIVVGDEPPPPQDDDQGSDREGGGVVTTPVLLPPYDDVSEGVIDSDGDGSGDGGSGVDSDGAIVSLESEPPF
jgi:hypothetical protein